MVNGPERSVKNRSIATGSWIHLSFKKITTIEWSGCVFKIVFLNRVQGVMNVFPCNPHRWKYEWMIGMGPVTSAPSRPLSSVHHGGEWNEDVWKVRWVQ